MTDPRSDTIDLGEILGTLRRGWRWIAGGAVAGVLVAVVLVLVLPSQYEGRTSVLLRPMTNDLGGLAQVSGRSGVGGRLGALGDLFSSDSGFDTELEILTSRSVIGAVVDSLGLQGRLRGAGSALLDDVFAEIRYPVRTDDLKLRFRRDGEAYRVRGGGEDTTVRPGEQGSVAGVEFRLAAGDLPRSFRLEVSSRQEAVRDVRRRLTVEEPGGDVAELAFRDPSPLRSAAVPNTLVDHYMQRRQTTDRGVNQHRYEFLRAHADSVAVQLARAEEEMRRQQEESGIFEPTVQGRAELEQALALRAEMEAIDVERRALQRILDGARSPRELAAYPTLLRSDAINRILTDLLALESQRLALLDRRQETDRDVMLITRQIEQLDSNLTSLSASYLSALEGQRAELQQELARYRAALDELPLSAQRHMRRAREVQRLAETQVALETHLIQARIAAIAEGGDVRQIDAAEVPERREFPRAAFFLPIGLMGGLLVGIALGLLRRYLARTVEDADTAALDTGLPAFLTAPTRPVLVTGWGEEGRILVVPVDPEAGAGDTGVRIAETTSLQGRAVAVADLEAATAQAGVRPMLPAGDRAAPGADETGDGSGRALVPFGEAGSAVKADYSIYRWGGNGASIGAIREAVDRLGERYERIVVVVPPMGHPVTTALLRETLPVVVVARRNRTSRHALRETVDGLRAAGLVPAAVAITPDADDADGRSSA